MRTSACTCCKCRSKSMTTEQFSHLVGHLIRIRHNSNSKRTPKKPAENFRSTFCYCVLKCYKQTFYDSTNGACKANSNSSALWLLNRLPPDLETTATKKKWLHLREYSYKKPTTITDGTLSTRYMYTYTEFSAYIYFLCINIENLPLFPKVSEEAHGICTPERHLVFIEVCLLIIN